MTVAKSETGESTSIENRETMLEMLDERVCGATLKHHNVGKARCVRVSAQKTPIRTILTHNEKQQNQSRDM